jgi:uncharacterized protein DUF4142
LQVKKFGQMMVDDDTSAGDKLKALASENGIEWPSQLDPKYQNKRDDLAKKQSAEFDRDYIASGPPSSSRLRTAIAAIRCACKKLVVQERVQQSLTCRCVKPPQTACLLAGQSKSRHFKVLAPHAPNKVLKWMMHRVFHEKLHHSTSDVASDVLELTASASIVERDTRLRCRRNASGSAGYARSPRQDNVASLMHPWVSGAQSIHVPSRL